MVYLQEGDVNLMFQYKVMDRVANFCQLCRSVHNAKAKGYAFMSQFLTNVTNNSQYNNGTALMLPSSEALKGFSFT